MQSSTNLDLFSRSPRQILSRLALPMIACNLLQQVYSLSDALIIGRYLGLDALAAVGAALALVVFLTSIIIGLGLGANVAFSQRIGANNLKLLKVDLTHAGCLILASTFVLQGLALTFLPQLLGLLRVDSQIYALTRTYLIWLILGLTTVAIFNYCTAILRSYGDTRSPLLALGLATILNISLDYSLIVIIPLGIKGAAIATFIAQALASLLLVLMTYFKVREFKGAWCKQALSNLKIAYFKRLWQLSLLTAIQQSIMNFGILLIQSLVNSYGYTVTAAFTAAVRIDAFAYMPVQDFGNAYATLVAHFTGAKAKERLRQATKQAFLFSTCFALILSLIIVIPATFWLNLFLPKASTAILEVGKNYLLIEASFYFGIAWLFLWYGHYRGLGQVNFSIVLTIISLGLRVLIAYVFSPSFGLMAIWWAIPIGWLIADLCAYFRYRKMANK